MDDFFRHPAKSTRFFEPENGASNDKEWSARSSKNRSAKANEAD
jgi:hypothetical protein